MLPQPVQGRCVELQEALERNQELLQLLSAMQTAPPDCLAEGGGQAPRRSGRLNKGGEGVAASADHCRRPRSKSKVMQAGARSQVPQGQTSRRSKGGSRDTSSRSREVKLGADAPPQVGMARFLQNGNGIWKLLKKGASFDSAGADVIK